MRYSVWELTLDSNWFSLQQWVFDTGLEKIERHTNCSWYFQILVVASPGTYAGMLVFFFFFFEKNLGWGIFYENFLFSLAWDPMAAKLSKCYVLLLQITAASFQNFPEFSSKWSSQNSVWDFWNFQFPIFNVFFFFFKKNLPVKQFQHCTLWKKQKLQYIIWKMRDHRATRSEIWNSRVVAVYI